MKSGIPEKEVVVNGLNYLEINLLKQEENQIKVVQDLEKLERKKNKNRKKLLYKKVVVKEL